MKEVVDSIKYTIHERVTSPFTGSFIISWLIINWKIVLAIFTNEKYINKVSHIEQVLAIHGGTLLFWWPLGAALVYVSVYQFFLGGIHWVWIKGSNFNKRMQKEKLYTRKELDRQIKRLEDIIETKERTVESSRRETEVHKKLVEGVTSDLKEERKQWKTKENDLDQEINNLKAQNAESEKERDTARKQKKNAEEVLEKTTEQLNTEIDVNKRLQTKLKYFTDRYNKINSELKNVKTEKEELATANLTSKGFVEDIKFRDGEIDSLNREIVRLMEENEDLKANINKIEYSFPRYLVDDEFKKCEMCNNDAVFELEPNIYRCDDHFEGGLGRA